MLRKRRPEAGDITPRARIAAMRRALRIGALGAAAMAVWCSPWGDRRVATTSAPQQREQAVPKELLERLADTAEQFVAGYQNYAAEETLVQTKFDKKGNIEAQKKIVSDFVVLRVGGPPQAGGAGELLELRDVISADGKEVQPLEKRNAKWAKVTSSVTRQELIALFQDPVSHSLFPDHFAHLGLLVTRFAQRNREKLKIFFAPDSSDAAANRVLIAYRQVAGEGLFSLEGKSVPTSGQAWVDPDTGAIYRMEESFNDKSARYWVGVDFTRDTKENSTMLLRVVVRIFQKGRLETQSEYSYGAFRALNAWPRAQAAPLRP